MLILLMLGEKVKKTIAYIGFTQSMFKKVLMKIVFDFDIIN